MNYNEPNTDTNMYPNKTILSPKKTQALDEDKLTTDHDLNSVRFYHQVILFKKF